MSTYVHRWNIAEFLCKEFYRSPKQLKFGYFRGVFVLRLQLKWHNFGQWESFWGLVDIWRMCHSWVSFGGGRMVWAIYAHKELQLLVKCQLSALQNYTLQRHSPGGDTCIDKFSSTAARVFNNVTYLLNSLLSLYCRVPQDTLQPV